MPVFPLDATLAIVSALTSFVLGLLVWVRRPKASGNILFALIATCMGIWALAGWALMATDGLPTWHRRLWEILFYESVFLAPALATHAAAYLSRKHGWRSIAYIYVASLASCAAYVLGFSPSFATGLSLLTYVGAVLYMAIELYPMTLGAKPAFLLDRRRASYGILILAVYLIAGCLQIATGISPSTLTLPILSAFFLGLSLLAFMRISFLDVDINPVEAFFLPLFAFFLVGYLRAKGSDEAVMSVISTASIGIFGIAALRAVRGEQDKLHALREENERLSLAEEARREFMDLVAHQLRTPLGGIRASASMLSEGDYGDIPQAAKKAADLMEDAATRLLSLADTFLNASRVDAGVYQTHRDVTDVRAEVAAVVAELAMFAENKGLTIEDSIDKSFDDMVRIDREVLHNSLSNLLDNAVKYTQHGRVHVRCTSLPGPKLSCSVSDTGQGMTETESSRLFKKFQRGRTREQEGLGLGLYVVKRLVDAAGGGISFSSEGPGKGSTFGFQLPYEHVDGAKADR